MSTLIQRGQAHLVQNWPPPGVCAGVICLCLASWLVVGCLFKLRWCRRVRAEVNYFAVAGWSWAILGPKVCRLVGGGASLGMSSVGWWWWCVCVVGGPWA